ncbi:hypothetical protein [Paraflavitalea sp. CAU 1676]|uniref:hypothetical protein n=1 Tax=Paraflavitalea sp. CAU 1676 TaxID=3032598 RepID=UPI0023DBBE06|nr:hypothetical protein [Paraflavitalea sp. CAU 1676]MDF2187891.1 hypothetical protein [Paraflavitalea sp. CAU 1676]
MKNATSNKIQSIHITQKIQQICTLIIPKVVAQQKKLSHPVAQLQFTFEETELEPILPFSFSLLADDGTTLFEAEISLLRVSTKGLYTVSDLQMNSLFERFTARFEDDHPDIEETAQIVRYLARYECMLALKELAQTLSAKGIVLKKKYVTGINDLDHEIKGGKTDPDTSLSKIKREFTHELKAITSRKVKTTFLEFCYGEGTK